MQKKDKKKADKEAQILTLLFQQGNYAALEHAAVRFTSLYPDYPFGHKALGAALLARNALHEAIPVLLRGLELEAKDYELLSNLGIAYSGLGQHLKAIAIFRRALRLQALDADLYANLCQAQLSAGMCHEALQTARQGLAIAPQSADINRLLANALVRLGYASQALPHAQFAVERNRGEVLPWMTLANVFRMQGDWAGAESAYTEALQRPDSLRSNSGEAIAQRMMCRMQALKWDALTDDTELLTQWLHEAEHHVLAPFPLLGLPGVSGDMQRIAAERYARRRLAQLLDSVENTKLPIPQPRQRLRIAYLSWDFRDHAVARLIAGHLEQHDKEKFELFAYSAGPDDQSAMRRRIMTAFDVFHDIADLSNEQVVQRIRDDGIDILIDLMGWTAGTRLEVLALRAAPLQLTWLGYPGTSGSRGACDYLIGDAWVTPIQRSDEFSERLALLPHCYQPNDRERPLPPPPTRTSVGLPEQAFVCCSFNQAFKLNPPTLHIWCALLRQVPNAVLWLLQMDAEAQVRLEAWLACEGIAADRVIYAPKVSQADHLARLQLADLALDTFPYNSHTTGSDALWAGVPMVAKVGDTFAGRVGQSLLLAAGLPQMLAQDDDEWLQINLRLAQDVAWRTEIKQALVYARHASPLFDQARFCRNFERLLNTLWQHRCAEELPDLVVLTE